MNLRDGLLAVRNKIQEINPNFWSDDELVTDLNISARRMASAAQCLESFATFNTGLDPFGNWAQEYVLPKDVDQITRVSDYSGVIYPITPVPAAAVQLGGMVSSIPFYCYIKKMTKVLTPQISTGITSYPFPGAANDARTVLGLYPIPNSVLPVYVWYQQWHPDLKEPFDEVQLPDRFKQAWVAYAVARAKEKEMDLDSAAYYDKIHEAGTQELIDTMINNGQEITPPMYSNRQIPPYFLHGANTILVVNQSPGVTNF